LVIDALLVMAIILSCLFFRVVVEEQEIKPFEIIQSAKWYENKWNVEHCYARIMNEGQAYELLLPNNRWCEDWSPTALGLEFYLELKYGVILTYYYLFSLCIAVFFCLGKVLFRSKTAGVMLAVLIGFSSHTEYFSGWWPSYFYLINAYIAISLIALYRILQRETKNMGWWYALLTLSIIALGHGDFWWANYGTALFIGLSIVGAYQAFYKLERGPRLSSIAISWFIVASEWALHIVTRALYVHSHHRLGHEEEMIFRYNHTILMVEDFISNIFTYIYVTVANFLPTQVIASNSFELGPDVIIAGQHNFYFPFSELALHNHLFLWRYAAGVFFTILIYITYRTSVKSFRDPKEIDILKLFSLAMVWCGMAVNLLIKFRGYLSMPLAFGYKVNVGVVGLGIYLTIVILEWGDKIKCPRYLLGSLYCAYLVYLAFTKPYYFNLYTEYFGLYIVADPLDWFNK